MNDNNKRDFGSIPAAACCMVVGEPEFGDNGEGAKSAPVRLTARSGKPIEHWFWGRVVHDLAGMRVHKSRLPIDYVHDAKEVIGYLNKFETESGDLVTSGALVPYKDGDRATEILHKFRQGVPYEASINFGGDGIKVQELLEGEVAEVNGYQFDGPGVIVREWPLRGVAICPYGADMNTKSAEFAAGKTFQAAVVAAPEAETKEVAMSKSVEVAAQVDATEAQEELSEGVEDVVAEEVVDVAADAEVSDEAEPVEADEAVDAGDVVESAEEESVDAETARLGVIGRDELAQIADEFGADIAIRMVKEGGDYATALRAAYDALLVEVKQLREASAESLSVGMPVAARHAEAEKKSLFQTGK